MNANNDAVVVDAEVVLPLGFSEHDPIPQDPEGVKTLIHKLRKELMEVRRNGEERVEAQIGLNKRITEVNEGLINRSLEKVLVDCLKNSEEVTCWLEDRIAEVFAVQDIDVEVVTGIEPVIEEAVRDATSELDTDCIRGLEDFVRDEVCEQVSNIEIRSEIVE